MDDQLPQDALSIKGIGELSDSENDVAIVSTSGKVPPEIKDLFETYRVPLTGTLRRLYGDGPPDPDDVAQQAFQNLIERGDFDTILNLKAFVWRTAKNIIFAAKRSRAVRSKYDYEVEQFYFPLKTDVSTPESIIQAKEQLEAVNECLSKMPLKRRRAFMLHRVEGLSIAETGRRLGIGRTTAAQHISRAVADLDLFLFERGLQDERSRP
ncbi:MAG: sigma-70 family RNA polymerase sigma factor [Pseudomonadota bacterium]